MLSARSNQRPHGSTKALPNVIETIQPHARQLVHVQAPVDLDHDGSDPEITLIEAHGHERTGKRSVNRHAPTELLERAHGEVLQCTGSMAPVRSDADVGTVLVLVILVGQRVRREAVPVEQQALPVRL